MSADVVDLAVYRALRLADKLGLPRIPFNPPSPELLQMLREMAETRREFERITGFFNP